MTQLLPYVVAHTDGVLPADVAVDPDHVVWEPGPPEGEFPTTLVQRDLRTGRTVTLDRNVSPLGGLASSAEWVAYVTPTQPEHVVMVRHDGTDRRVIATAPIAPITGRGDLVAWAQEKNGRQQVVVLDTQSGRRWVAADVPACIGQRCYRIDWVTLADEGVVFDRGATGPQASYVVRRRFTDPRPEEVTLPDDPQPDLVPSSSGAFYNWFGHGWFRWDFGAQPVPAGVPDTARGLPLGFEDGTILLVRETTDCRFQLLALSGDGRTSVVSDPATPGVLLNQRPEDCFQLTAVATTSRQVLSGWMLIPKSNEQGHSDTGVNGLLLASRPFSE